LEEVQIKKELLELAKKHSIKKPKETIETIYSVVQNFKVYAKEVDINKKYVDEIFKQFVVLD
jgi:hypothetical protein